METRSVALSTLDNAAPGFRLDGKAAVVTGGGSGIGQAIALRFAASGAYLSILDLTKDAADDTARQITEAGGRAQAYACDVSERKRVDAVLGQICSRERVHILVNSAGIAHVGKLGNTSEEDFDRVFRVNVKGTFHCMAATVEPMRRQGGGVILNMASVAAWAGLPDRFAYSMSKGAVVSMTYSVAKDYLADKIRCNCISPARVHTPFVDGFLQKNYPGREKEMFATLSQTQPIGRMASPSEVAGLALFLCSDEASFITGMDYPIDGGFLNLR